MLPDPPVLMEAARIRTRTLDHRVVHAGGSRLALAAGVAAQSSDGMPPMDDGRDGSTVAGRLWIENGGGGWQGTYQGVIFPHAPGMARHQAVLYDDPTKTDDTLEV